MDLRGYRLCPVGELDSLLSNLCCRVLGRQQIQILLSDLQLTVTSQDISVLSVLGVQRSKLPVLAGLAVGILEANNLAEDCDLLNEVLQRSGVDREAGLTIGGFEASTFLLLQFLGPDSNNLFELRTSKEAE